MSAFVSTIAFVIAFEGGPPPAVLAAGGSFGGISQILFGSDAMIARRQVLSAAAPQAASSGPRLLAAPFVAPIRSRDGANGGVIGLTAAW